MQQNKLLVLVAEMLGAVRIPRIPSIHLLDLRNIQVLFKLIYVLHGQATYLFISDLKARGFLWNILVMYFLGLKSL